MSIEKTGYVYIAASRKNGTIYVGITSDLIKRMWQHKNKTYGGFTARYGADKLVYYEIFNEMRAAISREKRLKFYKRAWKVALIEKDNPDWTDLYWRII